MRFCILPVTAFLFLLVSCGWNQREKQEQTQPIHIEESLDSIALLEEDTVTGEPFQDSIQKKYYSREGIQWKGFHFKPLNDWKQDITLVFTASDGTIDSLTFTGDYDGYALEDYKVYEEDINFDGTLDLQIFMGYKTDYNCVYYKGFVWDTENGGFVLVPNYEDIFNPVVYGKDQYIVGVNRGMLAASGADGEWPNGAMFWSCDKYQWIDGKLVVTKTLEKVIDMDEVDDFDFDAWMENEFNK